MHFSTESRLGVSSRRPKSQEQFKAARQEKEGGRESRGDKELGRRTFFNGGFIIGNDYVRMYIVKHHHTWGELRLVRRVNIFCVSFVKKKKRREGWEGGKSAWEKRLLVWGSNPCLFRLRQAKGESVNLGGVIEKIYFTFLGAMERKEKQPCCIFSATLWVHSRDHDRCGRALAAHVH